MNTETPPPVHRLFPAAPGPAKPPPRPTAAQEYAELYGALFDLSTPASRAAAIQNWLERGPDERAFITAHLQAMQLRAIFDLTATLAVLTQRVDVKLDDVVAAVTMNAEMTRDLAVALASDEDDPAEVDGQL